MRGTAHTTNVFNKNNAAFVRIVCVGGDFLLLLKLKLNVYVVRLAVGVAGRCGATCGSGSEVSVPFRSRLFAMV